MKRIFAGFVSVLIVLFLCTGSAYASILVYDGLGSQDEIQNAMTELGYAFDVWYPTNTYTAAQLADYEALVIGWNLDGDMGGLDAGVLDAAITGNILLTGHDADFHVVHGYDAGSGGDAVDTAATAFLDQAITWASSESGTGLVALGDYSTAFSYLPSGWGISATGGLVEETVSSITADGYASGVYDGLTPSDMSDWGQSYHAEFTAWGSDFTAFELGSGVTIGTPVPEPSTMLLLGAGLVGLLGFGRKKFFK